MPVAIWMGAVVSRSTATSMLVSFVRRSTRGHRADHSGPSLLVRSIQANTQTAYAEVGRQLQIRIAVADDRAGGEVHAARAHELLQQPGFRFAAGAVVLFEVRADEDRVERDALRAESLQDELVRLVEGGSWQRGRTQPILIGDHHKTIAAAFELGQ